MLGGEGKAAKKEMEAIFKEIDINLENNYKDLAILAKKKAESKLPMLKSKLKPKDYVIFETKLKEYIKRMEGYHH